MEPEITKKFNDTDKRIDEVEEDVKALQIFVAGSNEKMTAVCDKCGYIWRTKSKLSTVSCPNCGAKVKRENTKESESNADEWINQEVKTNKKYPTNFR